MTRTRSAGPPAGTEAIRWRRRPRRASVSGLTESGRATVSVGHESLTTVRLRVRADPPAPGPSPAVGMYVQVVWRPGGLHMIPGGAAPTVTLTT